LVPLAGARIVARQQYAPTIWVFRDSICLGLALACRAYLLQTAHLRMKLRIISDRETAKVCSFYIHTKNMDLAQQQSWPSSAERADNIANR